MEERGWALDLAELERSYQAAKVRFHTCSVLHMYNFLLLNKLTNYCSIVLIVFQDNCDVKAIVIINPGNPTGQVRKY